MRQLRWPCSLYAPVLLVRFVRFGARPIGGGQESEQTAECNNDRSPIELYAQHRDHDCRVQVCYRILNRGVSNSELTHTFGGSALRYGRWSG
jgi:hypothetical protein